MNPKIIAAAGLCAVLLAACSQTTENKAAEATDTAGVAAGPGLGLGTGVGFRAAGGRHAAPGRLGRIAGQRAAGLRDDRGRSQIFHAPDADAFDIFVGRHLGGRLVALALRQRGRQVHCGRKVDGQRRALLPIARNL